MKNFPKAVFNISNDDAFYSNMDNYGSSNFIDRSFYNHTIINSNNVLQISGYGALFDSNIKYLNILYPNNINIEDREFTIDLMVYFNTVNNVCLLEICEISNSKLSLRVNESGNGTSCSLGLTRYDINSSIVSGRWYHICWSRNFDLLFGFINGVKLFETNINGKSIGLGNIRIGYPLSGIVGGVSNFYLKNIRITTNVCRYSHSFAPITIPLPTPTILNTNSDNSNNFGYTNIASTIKLDLSNTIKTINLNSIINPSYSILKLINIPDIIGSGEFTIEFYIYIQNLTGSYLILTPIGVLNSWGLQILNDILIWTNNNNDKYYSTPSIKLGWNHICISRKLNIIRIWLNTNLEHSIIDSSIYIIPDNTLSIGQIVGYHRGIYYKSFLKRLNISTIHTFVIPDNWIGSIIYFKLGYFLNSLSFGNIILNVNIYKSRIHNNFIDYDNLLISQFNIISIKGSLNKFKEVVLKTTIHDLETVSRTECYTILITRVSTNINDTYLEDFNVLYIKALLMPDIKTKITDPIILYSSIDSVNTVSDYNVELIDNGKIFNAGCKELDYYLPLPEENFKQLNFNNSPGKNSKIYSQLGIFTSNISKSNILQFYSYDNEWQIITNVNWDLKFNYFEVIKLWYIEYIKFYLSSITTKNSSITNSITYLDILNISQSKYFGSVLAPDNTIYCIPYDSNTILKIIPGINPTYKTSNDIPGLAKYSGGVLAPDGCIYCIPYNSSNILKIIPGDPPTTILYTGVPGTAKHIGGVLGPDGNIYCPPYNSNTILKIIPGTPPICITFGNIPGTAKYSGAVLGLDGNIYCIPYNSINILKIIPTTIPTYSVSNNIPGTAKYSGGALAPNGNIYCIPYNSSTVLKIIPGNPPTISHSNNIPGTAKYFGGTLGPDGNIYCAPYGSNNILKIIPGDIPVVNTINIPEININKYVGGILSIDNSIYMIPFNSQKIIKIKFNSFRHFINDILLSGYLNKF
jgi:hypothetical protein